jgi:rhodanese-related sulfurtransferase
MSEPQASGYAGDVSASEAWENLAKVAGATLIDVRTQAEWAYVGVPVLNQIGKSTIFIEWDEFPSGRLVPDFIGRLRAALARENVAGDAPLYFICRSGNRSRQAAMQAAAAGFAHTYNVVPGFEGRLDEARHRDSKESWKGAGLPWVQS